MDADIGQGEALTRHHPDFASSVEPAIWPLVEELVFGWGLVTYSSCEGHHLVSQDRFTDAYVGIIAPDAEFGETIGALLASAAAVCEVGSGRVHVRQRLLTGPNDGSVDAVDLVLKKSASSSWTEYLGWRNEALAAVTTFLRSQRPTERKPADV